MTTEAPPVGRVRTAHDEKMLTILEHLEELRGRIVWCAIALVVGVAVSIYPLTGWAISFMIQPGKNQVEGFQLHQFQLMEYWGTYFRVSMLLGLALAMPVLMYHVFAFIGPGLTKDEKRWVYPIALGCGLMFLAGMAFAYYLELPPALKFLLNTKNEDVVPTIGVATYIDTVTRLLFITGLTFELPFVIMGLAKIGVITSKKLWEWWRYAIVGATVIAAVVTPSIDPITQIVVMIPLLILYAMGIGLARLVEGNAFIRQRR